jgi:hypothetical protein
MKFYCKTYEVLKLRKFITYEKLFANHQNLVIHFY